MGKTRTTMSSDSPKKMKPALSPEAREDQLIFLATNLAEQQLLDGTASSQVITHYLKLGSTKERLEKEKLETENKLLQQKIENMKADQKNEAFYDKVLTYMKAYNGLGSIEEDAEDIQ